ncbi:MAG: LysR family transcriptional regulator [Burkholderiales bacterium]|nr:LysR family transcriptional regulator [Burkholderiales bacterium]
MELRSLRYALAVAKARSFTRAAGRLHISQSAVSEQVAKLETEIGFALFDRVGHGVEVTDGGRAFLAEAERVLGEVGSLARAADRLRGRLVDTVALGMGSGMAQIFIPRLFPAVSERAPQLRLDILTAPTKSIFQDLHDQRIDLGIAIAASPERVPSGLAQEPIAELDLALVVHPRHRLAGRSRAVDLGTVIGEPMVMNELTVGYGEVVMSLFADLGMRPNILSVADNIETMKVIVQQGRSAAVMPAAAAAREAKAGLLRVLPIAPARKVGLSLYRRREPAAPKREGYLALITEALKTPPSRRA